MINDNDNDNDTKYFNKHFNKYCKYYNEMPRLGVFRVAGKLKKLVVAISSSALFDLRESDLVYRTEGVAAYAAYQIAREAEPLAPGDAFVLVKKLLRLNSLLQGDEQVEVILLSRNTADTGLRVFNSIQHHQLAISRAAFTGGSAPYRYMRPFRCHLFLSTNPEDVREALENGMAAASILPSASLAVDSPLLQFAFDGDAVLFSDEAEQIYQSAGLDAFTSNEQAAANEPLMGGPFKPFLAALHELQSEFAAGECPIRTALVTARAAPAHERVIKTLRAWNIRHDESLFLGGMRKAEFLQAYGADVFFDDQAEHCRLASEVVATGHVPHGIANQR
jgi:5'-nucleotidase